MKKLFLSILATLGVALLIPASSFALSSKTDITGTVYNNGHIVSGANVTVVCNNNVKHDTTDGNGVYLVQFNANQCPKGTTVYVTAVKGKKGGDSTGTASPLTTKLNVALVNVDLPEFGILAGISAAVIGGGAFLVVRRRQLGANQA